MELERTIGITALSNAAIGVNAASKTVAFPCGSVVTEYNPKKNRQVDFYDCDQCISCVTYSPDSSLVAVGQRGSKSSLVVWRCASKELLFSGHGHRFGIACAAFSADGRYIASVGYKNDGKIFLWDVQRRRAVARGAVSAGVSSIDYNAALNAFVTAGADSALHFWYLADIAPQLAAAATAAGTAKAGGAPPRELVAFEPKAARFGDKLGPKTVDFVDVCCGRGGTACETYTYTVTSSGLLCCFNSARLPYRWVDLRVNHAFSLDVTATRIFVGCSDATIRVFEPGTLRYVESLAKMKLREIHQTNTSSVEWPAAADAAAAAPKPPEGVAADSANGSGAAAVLEPAVVCLKAIANTNRIIAVYGDRSIFIFDVSEKLAMYRSFLHHTGCIWDLVVVPYRTDGACGAAGGGSSAATSPPGATPASCCVPPGSFLSCGSDGTVRFWTLDRNRSSYAARPEAWRHKYSRQLLRVLNCGCSFSVKQDNATVYATQSVERAQMHPPNAGVRQLAVSCDGSALAVGTKRGGLAVVDLHSPALALVAPPVAAHESDVTSLNFSPLPPGQQQQQGGVPGTPITPRPLQRPLLVTGGRDKQAKVFDAETLECLATLRHHKTSVRVADFDRSGRRIVTCGSETPARIVTVERSLKNDRAFGESSIVEGGVQGFIFDAQVHVTNKFLLTTGTDRKVHVWAMRPRLQKAPMRSYAFDNMEFYRLRMDPSGSYVALCGEDQRVRIIDIISGACLAISPARHSARITAVAFTPDCQRILTACVDGCIFVWKLSWALVTRMRGRLDELGLPYSANPLKSKLSGNSGGVGAGAGASAGAPAIPPVLAALAGGGDGGGATAAAPPALPAAVVQNNLGTTAAVIRDNDGLDTGGGGGGGGDDDDDMAATVAEMPSWAQTQKPNHKTVTEGGGSSSSSSSSSKGPAEPIPKNSRWRPPASTIRIKEEALAATAAAATAGAAAGDTVAPGESVRLPLWAQGGAAAADASPEDTLAAGIAISQQSGKASKWAAPVVAIAAAPSDPSPDAHAHVHADPHANPSTVAHLASTSEVLRPKACSGGGSGGGMGASQTVSVPSWAKDSGSGGGSSDYDDDDDDDDDEMGNGKGVLIFENDHTQSAAAFSVTQSGKADPSPCGEGGGGGVDVGGTAAAEAAAAAAASAPATTAAPAAAAAPAPSPAPASGGGGAAETDAVALSLARMRQRRQGMGLPATLRSPSSDGASTALTPGAAAAAARPAPAVAAATTTPAPAPTPAPAAAVPAVAAAPPSLAQDCAALAATAAQLTERLVRASPADAADAADAVRALAPALRRLLQLAGENAAAAAGNAATAPASAPMDAKMEAMLERYSALLVDRVAARLHQKEQ